MADTTVIKINSHYSPGDGKGKTYLASGRTVSMRLWKESPNVNGESSIRDYETVGYVVSGHAELETEGQIVKLEAGDSWVVPKGAEHKYRIIDEFVAVEATAPPAQVHARDEKSDR